MSTLKDEEFGPVLHVVRYKPKEIDKVMAQIGDTGFGLTFGIHSRIEGYWLDLFSKNAVGNTYVNRNMIGAVVGVQPFGGMGLSGTGPKAGGPNYMQRFMQKFSDGNNGDKYAPDNSDIVVGPDQIQSAVDNLSKPNK